MNPQVDQYLVAGCGRCELHGTPQCKVNDWRDHLQLLRDVVLSFDMSEELKWGQPCYTYERANVLLIYALKDHCGIGFFKGTLLDDQHKLLVAPGKSSQAARRLQFTRVADIVENEDAIRFYISQAIEVERAGHKVEFKQVPEPMPEELTERLLVDEELRVAFEALTPGRRRGYILHFSSAKQSQTRKARIEKCRPKILAGKGMQDR